MDPLIKQPLQTQALSNYNSLFVSKLCNVIKDKDHLVKFQKAGF